MKTLLKIILLSIAGMSYSTGAVSAGEPVAIVSDSARIIFHQSKTNLDTAYCDNGRHLAEMVARLRGIQENDSLKLLRRIRVVGGASPEGSVRFNDELSRARADRIFNYFSEMNGLPDSLAEYRFLGRDWKGLRLLVGDDENVPCRDEVISMLDDIINDCAENGDDGFGNLNRLKRLGGGKPYLYMYRNLFPRLRESRLYFDYEYLPRVEVCDIPVMPNDADTLVTELIEIPGIEEIKYGEVKECRPFYMDVKTNLIYDALALPNLGAEFYVGKNWSVVGNWIYGWWDNDPGHRYWRAYGGDLGVRRWFGTKASEKPLTGHHLGVFAGVITYDFELGGEGIMGGLPHKTLWDRCNYMAGVEYGYTLPIGRRLNLDFTIGIGYLGGRYIKYTPEDDEYVWESTNKMRWFGPVKAEISLEWLIGCDNYNRKKGATR